MCQFRYLEVTMGILYSIPLKVIGNNGALKCTIPKQIAEKMQVVRGDTIIWVLFDDGHVELKKETG